MNTNRFNQILIVDSIPLGEINTAKRLYEDVVTYANAYKPSPAILYERVESGEGFINLLRRCTSDASRTGDIPLLHIECHGGEHGLQFADESFLDWSELKAPLTELNIATGLNLLVTVAACLGAAMVQVLKVGERAPFYGLIAPGRNMFPDELERPFRALFTTLLETKSAADSVKAMEVVSKPGDYGRTTAEHLFGRVWQGYIDNYCTPPVLRSSASDLRVKMKQEGKEVPSIEVVARLLLDAGLNKRRQYHETFFMFDLHPENQHRFPYSED